MSDDPKPDRDGPDPELLRRARSGEKGALEELLRVVHPRVRRWALVRTGDPAEAEDVAQEALVRVVRGLASFRGDSSFGTWLYRIVANTTRDRIRADRRRKRREEEGMRHATTHGRGDPAGDLDRDRLLARVRECFLGLTERQREIFELAELQGLDSTEVGETLGIAPATVRVTLLRARRTLREQILRTDPDLVEAFFT